MSTYVVDASVAAKWLFREHLTENAMKVLEPGNRLHAPDFFLLETDSLLCKRVRRGLISPPEAADFRARLRVFPIEFHGFSSLQERAFEIALQTRRSPYDCLYLVLAMLLECRDVTADRPFYDELAAGPFGEHVLWLGDLT
jgi:predicted nucleic acid-binding protein